MYSDPATLDDIEFLVSSPNRLKVFDVIRTAPRPRHEISERIDASRVTLSRILRDLENRRWIERSGGEYDTTPRGEVVASEVAQLFANLEALDGLEDALPWLPIELFDFDLACLTDATVVTSTKRNLTAAITRTATHVREATRVRNIARGISAEVIEAYLKAAQHDDRSLETILCSSVFDTIRDDVTLKAQLRAMLESDQITVRRYDGQEHPIILTVADDFVLMCGQSNPQSPPDVLETADESIRAWADRFIDGISAEATTVTSDAFTV